MAKTTPRFFTFNREKPDPLLGALKRIWQRGDGSWVNFAAVSDFEEPPPTFGFGWLRTRGPAVPMVTIVGPVNGKRPTAPSLGFQHGLGPKSLKALGDELGVAEGWIPRQDHPKRGIVFDLPADVDAQALLDWSLSAVDYLTRIELGDTFWVETFDV